MFLCLFCVMNTFSLNVVVISLCYRKQNVVFFSTSNIILGFILTCLLSSSILTHVKHFTSYYSYLCSHISLDIWIKNKEVWLLWIFLSGSDPVTMDIRYFSDFFFHIHTHPEPSGSDSNPT